MNETCGSKVGDSGFVVNGFFFQRIESGDFSFASYTVEDGIYTLNFDCVLDANGKLIHGTVNCFVFSYKKMEQDYIDEVIQEIQEKTKFNWDQIILQ